MFHIILTLVIYMSTEAPLVKQLNDVIPLQFETLLECEDMRINPIGPVSYYVAKATRKVADSGPLPFVINTKCFSLDNA